MDLRSRYNDWKGMNVWGASFAGASTYLPPDKNPPLTWRNIHGSGAPAVYGLSAWLVEQLKPFCVTLPALVESTEEFVNTLKNFRAEPGSKLYRADVKEFFMSGSPEVLEECTVSWLPEGPRKQVVAAVLRWLLNNQFVEIGASDPRVWRVLRGSGMGLKHSSYVADLTFAKLGDAWALRPEVRTAFGIVLFCRFRDDIFVISKRPQHMWRFFWCLRARTSRAFRIDVTEVSSTGVTILAVRVDVRNGRYVCSPRDRPEHVPLTWDSAHPAAVHRWWPVGHVLGMRRLCTLRSDYVLAVSRFCDRLRRFHTPSEFVAWVQHTARILERRSSPSSRVVTSRDMWFVLDWHSTHMYGDVARNISQFWQSDETQAVLRFLFAAPPGLRLSWRVAGRKLINCTRGTLHERMEVGEGGGRWGGPCGLKDPTFRSLFGSSLGSGPNLAASHNACELGRAQRSEPCSTRPEKTKLADLEVRYHHRVQVRPEISGT